MASLNSVPLLSSSSHRTVSAEMSFLLTRPRPGRRIIAFPAFFLVVNSRDGSSSGEGGDFGTKDKEGVVSCKAKTDLQVRVVKQNLSVFCGTDHIHTLCTGSHKTTVSRF